MFFFHIIELRISNNFSISIFTFLHFYKCYTRIFYCNSRTGMIQFIRLTECSARAVSYTHLIQENIYCYMKILRFLALYVATFFSSMAGTFQAEPLLCSFMDFFPVSFWADGSWHLLRWQMFSPSFPEGSN